MKKALLTLMLALFLSSMSMAADFQILLGDVDQFVYEGAVDWPEVDPAWMTFTQNRSPKPIVGFDSLFGNSLRPFTFDFDLAPGEEVIAAELTLGLRNTCSCSPDTYQIVIESDENVYPFLDLGWLPVSSTDTDIRSIDLSNALGDNLIPLLQDGQLNVIVEDDIGVDYAKLEYTTIPEPASILLLGLGALTLIQKRSQSSLSPSSGH